MRFLRTLLGLKQVPDQNESEGRDLYAALLHPNILGSALKICRLEDSLNNRFAALCLCAAVVLEGRSNRSLVERALVGAMVTDIDIAFRENSLGDASVKKYATNHAAALYGRLRAYEIMLRKEPADLDILARNLFANSPTKPQVRALPTILPQVQELIEAQL